MQHARNPTLWAAVFGGMLIFSVGYLAGSGTTTVRTVDASTATTGLVVRRNGAGAEAAPSVAPTAAGVEDARASCAPTAGAANCSCPSAAPCPAASPASTAAASPSAAPSGCPTPPAASKCPVPAPVVPGAAPVAKHETCAPRYTTKLNLGATTLETQLDCSGSDVFHRTCTAMNVCHDRRDNRWHLYGPPAANTGCFGGNYCPAENAMVYAIPLPYDDGLIRPVFTEGTAPAPGTQGVHWVADHAVVIARHQPGNFFHFTCDDMYNAHWLLRRYAHNPMCFLDGQHLPPALAAESAAAGKFKGIVLMQDGWGDVSIWRPSRLYNLWPGVEFIKTEVLHDRQQADVLCFKRLSLGSPGISVHQNGGYSWHPARTWVNPIDDGEHDEIVSAFARYWRAAWMTTWAGYTNLATYTPPVRDTIVVMDRPAGGSRHLNNIEEVINGLRANPGNWNVVGVTMETVEDKDLPGLMQKAVAFVGIHGAGLTSMILMQPGSIIVELIPQRVEVVNFFTTLSLSLDHSHHSIPLDPAGNGWDGPFTVNVPTLRGTLDIALRKFKADRDAKGPGAT